MDNCEMLQLMIALHNSTASVTSGISKEKNFKLQVYTGCESQHTLVIVGSHPIEHLKCTSGELRSCRWTARELTV